MSTDLITKIEGGNMMGKWNIYVDEPIEYYSDLHPIGWVCHICGAVYATYSQKQDCVFKHIERARD